MRGRFAPAIVGGLLAWSVLAGDAGAQRADRLSDDEHAVLFPTCAVPTVDGTGWSIPVHAWVYEPEEDSATRELALAAFAGALDLPEDDAVADERFRERAWPFLVDNERGKSLAVRVGGRQHPLLATWPSGHVHDSVRIAMPEDEPRAGPGRWTEVELVTGDADRAPVVTRSLLLPPEGVSVLSDIDDTVKISEVGDRRALLERTFLRPFEAVEGAAERYQAWARAGASLHFVSGSPWQLHAPLTAFLDAAGFPSATLHLREFRLKDRTALSMFDDPAAGKHKQLDALMGGFPRRRFVLVGDSGEQDPETYGDLARAHPGRVLLIAIRDVTGQARDDARYAEAFRDLPAELWVLWSRPDQIPTLEFEGAG